MLMFDDGATEMLPADEERPDYDDSGSAASGAGTSHEVEVGPMFSLTDISDSDDAGHGAGNDDKMNHLLTRKPADVTHCETCMRAKPRSLRKHSRDTNTPLQVW